MRGTIAFCKLGNKYFIYSDWVLNRVLSEKKESAKVWNELSYRIIKYYLYICNRDIAFLKLGTPKCQNDQTHTHFISDIFFRQTIKNERKINTHTQNFRHFISDK